MLGMVGLIEQADQAMTQWFKQEGDEVILLGATREDLGGSEYLKVIHAREQGSPPLLNMDTEKALHECVLALVRGGLVQSAHDCSDGGLAVALVESCISGPDRKLGAVVRLNPGRLRRDAVLFGESQSRVVLSAKPAHRQAILDQAKRLGVPAEIIGSVTGTRLSIRLGDAMMVDMSVSTLHDRWALSIEQTLNEA
jgi:phosphoribosylformylglycinamidine synthase